jgi:ATP-dependent Clp protease ATP-binding subunit ClpX
MENVELVLTDDALDEIVTIAQSKKTGARGLRLVLEKIMVDVMYEVPNRKELVSVVIDGDVIHGRKEPAFMHREPADAQKLAS